MTTAIERVNAMVRAYHHARPGLDLVLAPDVEDAALTALFRQERRGVLRVTRKCGECGWIIEEGGTVVEYEVCRTCGERIG